MSASGQPIGGNAIIRSPHTAPRNMRHETIQELAGRLPLRPVNSFARSRGKKDRAPFNPAIGYPVGQREDRLSETFPPVDGRAAQAGSLDAGQGNGLSHSFSSCAALKLSQFANAVFDVFVRIIRFLLLAICGVFITAVIAFVFLFIE